MTATLSESQRDLPRLVELVGQGEDVIITVAGEPRARLTRPPAPAPSPRAPTPVQREKWIEELAELRRSNDTGKHGPTVEEILAEDRADR